MEISIISITIGIMLLSFLLFIRAHNLSQSIASILTVIGLLGTFVGISGQTG